MFVKVCQSIRRRWYIECGYRELLVVAVPLILSTSAWAVQHFVDRMFLAWYAPEAVAACMPAGMANFTIMSLFIGTATYAGTFVAQYYGASRYDRIGPAVWQGMYVAAVGGIAHLFLIPAAGPLFRLAGHESLVRQYETVYFQILCLGAAPAIACSAMSGFFAGRGRTWPVMWVNVGATLVNVTMNYGLIFGKWGFPALGIKGAAIATVMAGCFGCVLYLALLSTPAYDRRFRTLHGWRFDPALFARLIRFGLPNGIQFCLDVLGFTVFIFLVGRLGTTELAATVIAFNVNTLAFMPMIGIAMAVSIFVGQQLGKNRPHLAERSVYSGFHITFLYMGTVAAMYMLVPDVFLKPFAAHAGPESLVAIRDTAPESFAAIRDIAVVLLRFVAIFCLFDMLNLVFAAAIKGAGDTRFVMLTLVVVSSLVLVVPSYIALVRLDANIYVGWAIATTYIAVLGLTFLFRFLGGKWKSMRVIEEMVPALPQTLPEAPTASVER